MRQDRDKCAMCVCVCVYLSVLSLVCFFRLCRRIRRKETKAGCAACLPACPWKRARNCNARLGSPMPPSSSTQDVHDYSDMPRSEILCRYCAPISLRSSKAELMKGPGPPTRVCTVRPVAPAARRGQRKDRTGSRPHGRRSRSYCGQRGRPRRSFRCGASILTRTCTSMRPHLERLSPIDVHPLHSPQTRFFRSSCSPALRKQRPPMRIPSYLPTYGRSWHRRRPPGFTP